MKKPLAYLLLLAILLPLVWIYTPNSHDWGGDFAAYIAQAENILSGLPVGETGYIYNPDYYRLAPPSYPNGFPLLLTPWIALFGSDIGGLVIYMSVLLVLFGLGFFKVMRLNFSPTVSLIAVIITFYNPWMIRFKAEVIADLPFAMLVTWTLLCYLSARKSKSRLFLKWSVCAVLLTLTLLTKTIGWVLLIAFALDTIIFVVRRKLLDPLIGLGFLTVSTLGIHWFVNELWLPSPANHLQHFSRIAQDHGGYWSSIWKNTFLYLDIYKAFFIKDLGVFDVVGKATANILLYFALIGAVVRWFKKGIHVTDWVFLGLMGALILFPITNGFRYLLPAFVFFLGYSIYGLCLLPWHYLLRRFLPFVALIFILTQYVKGWTKIADLPEVVVGPYHPDYENLHAHVDSIKAQVPNAVFAAAKPRVFSWMHGVEAFSVRPDLNDEMTLKQIRHLARGRPVYIVEIGFTPHASLDLLESRYQIRNGKGLRWKLKGPEFIITP